MAADFTVIPELFMFVEFPASNEPKKFICPIGIDVGVSSDSNNRFEQFRIVRLFRAQLNSSKNGSELRVWLSKVDIAKFLQKVTSQCEAQIVDFCMKEHGKCGSSTVVPVEEISPLVKRLGSGELRQEVGGIQSGPAVLRPDATGLARQLSL